MRKKFKTSAVSRRLACVGLTAVMGASLIGGQVFAFADGGKSAVPSERVQSVEFGNANGKVNLTDIKLSNLSKEVLKNEVPTEVAGVTQSVIVALDGEALLDRGTTDENVRRELEREQNAFLKELDKAGVSYTLKYNYYNVLNGVAIDVKLADVPQIKAMGGVSGVTLSQTYSQPKAIETSDGAQENYSNIYPTGIYNSSEYVEKGYTGSGMSVAILDTGLDYTHAAFSVYEEDGVTPKLDLDKTSIKYDGLESKMSGGSFSATKRSGATAGDVYVSQKVPFAYDYADSDADVYPSYNQHGTHVAGIVAGHDDHYDDKKGNRVDEDFRGVAPQAQLVICKVFTDNLDSESIGGAEAVDILAALDDCVNLGVDVINMSLGTTAGFSSKSLGWAENDIEGKQMRDVYARIRSAGISLMVAASNDYSAGYGSAFGTNLASNPDSGTVGSPSTFTGAMSIASINGQHSPYLIANAKDDGTGGDAIYFEESRNEDSDAFDFIDEMLDYDKTKNIATYKYVVVPGVGDPGDYTPKIKSELKDKSVGGKTIALVKRGSTNFKDKIKTAYDNGADGVIVYNNVSGMVRMSLGDMTLHVPSVSVSMEAGLTLTGSGSKKRTTGKITISRSTSSGPFMNDYSSWGTSPDLQLKPDITSHGGEITSTVAGGYAEMSGTSMACPNLAGFTALVKGYIGEKLGIDKATQPFELTKATNNMMMSTATVVYDQNKLPYSPRKQGAGLATLKNVFETNAYLYTKDTEDATDPDRMCEDGRPKAELGEDEKKSGEYRVKFYVKNFGDKTLTFATNSIFMTETLGVDGKSVAEKAHLFGNDATWKVDGEAVAEGGKFNVESGKVREIEVTLKLTATEKKYLNDNFKNGMFVEGFLQLKGENGQCDLTLPFMGFYGDWESSPMLDLTAFEVAADAKDTSLKDEQRRQPSVWATQAYAYYWNDKYVLPMGSYVYLQDEALEHTADYVYADEEHVAVSAFNEYYGANESGNYITSSGIKALYAGLLRNAEIVTYTLTNVDTGEILPDDNGNEIREIYRVNKAHSSGGSAIPAQVLMELRTADLGLRGNGKYRLDFDFYFDKDDYVDGTGTDDKFTMEFFVDYEAPVLVDSRIRFQDRKDENNKDVQSVYLDLDIFDNHYPQAVMLCYSPEGEGASAQSVKLATDYIVPVINPKKNTINTVSIDITDLYKDYHRYFFVELDDYALNSNVYYLNMDHSITEGVCPTDFKVTLNGKEVNEVTLDKNTTVKLSIDGAGNANVSNFAWESLMPSVASVKNGEIFGASAGESYITVRGGAGSYKNIKVTVKESTRTLATPSISFGTVLDSVDVPHKAEGIVEVNPAQKIQLSIEADPWYYPLDTLKFKFKSSNDALATVDENTGLVTIIYEGDKAQMVTITATAEGYPACTTSVAFSIQDPYTISNGTLTRYRGWGGELVGNRRVLTIPNDRSIMTIGDEAFKDGFNDGEHLSTIVIPKAVTEIGERAFLNCTTLEKICFIQEAAKEVRDSSLSMIHRDAFSGCTALKTVDLSNCKVITLDRNVFTDCTALEEVVRWESIGTAYERTFMGCTKLGSADLTYMHVAGDQVFANCTSLSSVTIGKNTALGRSMFSGCTSLQSVEINCPSIPAYAFNGCSSLTSVSIGSDLSLIGAYAFNNCSRLESFALNNHTVDEVGAYAFANCTQMNNPFASASFNPVIGENAFQHVVSVGDKVVSGSVLKLAPKKVDAAFSMDGITEIAPYAFSGSMMSGVSTIDISGVTKLGTGAFSGLRGLTSLTLNDTITEIPAYAFFGCADLTAVVIPASVKSIGECAFYGCTSLASIQFADGSALKEIGDMAFNGAKITELTLPDGVEKLGGEAFARCASLETVHISSVKEMGEGAFVYCNKLTEAYYGAGATTTGSYTFFAYDAATRRSQSSLTKVELSDNISIDAGAFAYCDKLTEIDLKNSAGGENSEIDAEAFYGCSALTTVTGIDKVTAIGDNAFAYCTSLTSLNLAAAKHIYYRAFLGDSKLTQVTFGDKLEGIGDEAFAATALTTVNIPAKCNYVGTSAFYGISTLKSYAVDTNNKYYTAVDGVLYRYIDKDKGVYEFAAYPADRVADKTDGTATYTVLEGTITVAEFAFGAVPANRVSKVVFPYTLKAIGSYAFDHSEISYFRFESIQAPALLERVATINGVPVRVINKENYSANSFYYNNFGVNLADYAPRFPGDSGENATAESPLKIAYPKNGVGYDNFVYINYFASNPVVLDEMPEDDTRTLKTMLEDMPDSTAVSGWNTTNKTKTEVEAFAEEVKTAHALYNSLKTQTQVDFVGKDNVAKLFAVEGALKDVKQAFGIVVRVRSVTVDASSAHKTAYTAGERFSLDGLKLLVVYDDYREEIIDASAGFKLEERYAERALRVTDEAVMLEGFGEYASMSVGVEVTVAEAVGGGETKGGLDTVVLVVIIVGAIALLAVAAVVTVVVLARKGIIFKGKWQKSSAPENGEKSADGADDSQTDGADDNTDSENNGENGGENAESNDGESVTDETESGDETDEEPKDGGEQTDD